MECPKCEALEELQPGASRLGELRWSVTGPDYEVNAPATAELVEQTCECVFTSQEYDKMAVQAVKEAYEYEP